MSEESFADRFKALRYRLNMSQDDMAKALEVTQNTISNYETGKRYPTVDVLQRLERFQNVDLNWLIFGSSSTLSLANPNDPNIADFIYWFNKLHIVRIEALASLAHLKIDRDWLFKKESDINEIKRPYHHKFKNQR